MKLTAKRFQSPLEISHCVSCVICARVIINNYLFFSFCLFVLSNMVSFELTVDKS